MTTSSESGLSQSGLSESGCRSRALAAALEPFVGSVYMAPEANEGYEALGFGTRTGRMTDPWGAAHWGEVELPDMVAYFTSRGSLLGQVSGEVVAAAFGVFNPAVVVPAVAAGWQIADAPAVCAARSRGAVAQLVRVLGERPDGLDRAVELLERAAGALDMMGRPMYAGVLSQTPPDGPLGRAWWLAEQLREHRGDGHIAAFTALGYDGCAVQVLTERAAGMPPRSYSMTRGWGGADFDAAEAGLRAAGLIDADGAVTAAGRAAREELEAATDALWTAPVTALGDDLPELVGILLPWNAALRAAAGYYPSSPQEAVMVGDVQVWMSAHGLEPFGGIGVGAAS